MTLLKNRDYLRKNRAHKAVQAHMYSKIHMKSLRRLELTYEKTRDASTDTEMKLLMDIAKKSGAKSTSMLDNSQTIINTATCYSYASHQHNLITNGIKYKENMDDIVGISSFIHDQELMEMYYNLYQSGK